MDYLDPRKRRAYNFRLIVGYILVAIVIGLSTYLLKLAANGYGYDIKTGQVVQNGLLFTDSNPSGAEIYLNGQDKHSTTSSRLILQSGSYNLTLKKEGYNDWSREFVLDEQSVARYVYPFLFPAAPKIDSVKAYQASPRLVTQSPDRRWMLVEVTEASSINPTFDMFDSTTLDRTSPAVTRVVLPTSALTKYSSKSKLKTVEWSTDNKHVLLSHIYPGGQEFIVFDRTRPSQTMNVNRLFKITPSEVSLYNKKTGQLYIFNKKDGSLSLGNTGTGLLAPVLTNNVLAFKPYGRNLILYVSGKNDTTGTVTARIWSSGTTYKLSEFGPGSKYLLDLAQFQGNFYYVAGSDSAGKAVIYKNPLDNIKNPAIAKAIPVLALQVSKAQKVSFSNIARFIALENAQHFAVYDIETGDSYRYTLTDNLTDSADWMDGHRFLGQSDGKVLVMDFDNTNKQLISESVEPFGGLFSGDYKHLLVITKTSKAKSYILQDIDMRAGADLPNQ
jgi:hypothetical protein